MNVFRNEKVLVIKKYRVLVSYEVRFYGLRILEIG